MLDLTDLCISEPQVLFFLSYQLRLKIDSAVFTHSSEMSIHNNSVILYSVPNSPCSCLSIIMYLRNKK
jgi:hypothetical protein